MRHCPLSGVLILLAGTASAAEPAASGTFSFRDVEYAAAHAVAWHTGGDYPSSHIVISNTPFDPAAIAADGVANDADLMAHAGATLMISYMPDDQTVLGIRLRNETGHGADFRCEGSGLLTVTSADGRSIAGRFACEEHQVAFTAALLPTPGE